MSMLSMTGQLFNIYIQPGGTNKEGGKFEDRDKIQLVGDFPLSNGQIKKGLVDLAIEDVSIYKGLEGKVISVPVGSYVTDRKEVGFYVPKGSKPSLSQIQQIQPKPL